jgi:hypothetical protein
LPPVAHADYHAATVLRRSVHHDVPWFDPPVYDPVLVEEYAKQSIPSKGIELPTDLDRSSEDFIDPSFVDLMFRTAGTGWVDIVAEFTGDREPIESVERLRERWFPHRKTFALIEQTVGRDAPTFEGFDEMKEASRRYDQSLNKLEETVRRDAGLVGITAFSSDRGYAIALAAAWSSHIGKGTATELNASSVVRPIELFPGSSDPLELDKTIVSTLGLEEKKNIFRRYPLENVLSLVSLPTPESGYPVTMGLTSDPDEESVESLAPVLPAEDVDRARPVTVGVNALQEHIVVCGASGSGKTFTMKSLLRRLYDIAGVPFMIIEPVKSEYRSLGDASVSGGRLANDIIFLTPGDESYRPIRFNLFEPFIPDGTVSEHINSVVSVFNDAFGWPDPAPLLFSRAVERAYINLGWPLYTPLNAIDRSERRYPTLYDVRFAADEVMSETEYKGDALGNLGQIMKTRIEFLLGGVVGQMFLCEKSVPSVPELLNRPVVLELDAFQSDVEQANLVTLFLLRSVFAWRRYERREANRSGNADSQSRLRHLLVVEEAHNFLSNSGRSSGEGFSPRSQTRDFFVKMLNEVRAYGQGIAVIDQAAGELPSAVLRNTATKIAHRMSHGTDIEAIAASMVLDDQLLAQLKTLTTGRCVMTAKGYQRPFPAQVLAQPVESGSMDALGDCELSGDDQYAVWYEEILRSASHIVVRLLQRFENDVFYEKDPVKSETKRTRLKQEFETRIGQLSRHVSPANMLYEQTKDRVRSVSPSDDLESTIREYQWYL